TVEIRGRKIAIIGGGGFMVIWNAEKREAVALDYRERAPKRATRKMFLGPKRHGGPRNAASRRGHLAVAVPGSVAGWCYAQKQYGRLPLAEVMAPALRAARDGVPVDAVMRTTQRSLRKQFADDPKLATRFAALKRLYLTRKRADRFFSPQRKVLERIAAHGRDGFYKGPVADAIVAEMKAGGGLISQADLAAMRPVVRKPLRGEFDGMSLLTMPPPSSGGVALLQMLNTLRAYETRHPERSLKKLVHNREQTVHLLTEIMKHAFADRAAYLGDADFVNVPVRKLIGRQYAKTLSQRIDGDRTHPPKYYGRFQPVDDAGTSHFCVLDAKGNAVSCTETINTAYGSLVVEPKYGIVLNNEMDDFAAVPGKPNAFGLIQSAANAVAPRKKPLSSMTPTILVKDGRAVYVVGASGGPRIISSVLQVLLNMSRYAMPPADAVSRPRFHHQWLPNVLYAEKGLYEKLRTPLAKRGHTVTLRNNLSATQAAMRSKDGLRAAGDPRKHGRAAGY
ncbi:MAG: gamma-glutamyltransferase, partial [Planctomycetaceae bacterium]